MPKRMYIGIVLKFKTNVSFGIVVWEIMTRSIPYGNMDVSLVILEVCTKNIRPEIPSDCPKYLVEIMEQCWKEDPNQRPDMSQILSKLGSQ